MFHSCSSSNKELIIRRTFLVLSIIVFIAAPHVHVRGECTCGSEQGGKDGDGNNTKQALKLKLGAIGSILGFGAFGVCLPLLSKISPGHAFLFMIKAFAAGVILATGFIHILPDAFDHLTSPCLKEKPWGDFPFTGFIAMMAAIGTLMVDTIATSYYKMIHSSKVDNSSNGGVVVGDEEKISGEHAGHAHAHAHAHAHVHDSHGTHGHGPIEESMGSIDLIRHRVISQVLELGIVVHSVVIGVSLGASETPTTIRTLLIALSFHQFFEGMGLGGCISQAKFKSRAILVMALFFACTTPVGIAIGIGISNVYDKNSPTAIIVEGCLNSASAGILIYMALVDLLAADFMSDRVQSSGKLQVQVYVCLLAGAASMSLLATWT